MVASAADLALLSALFLLFLREMLSTLSTRTHASIAVLALLSALFQLSLRVESKRNDEIKSSPPSLLGRLLFYFIIYIWRSQMNEEMLAFPSALGLINFRARLDSLLSACTLGLIDFSQDSQIL